jgi:hypothetical protein
VPWFKVSDDLPSKATTTRIPRQHRRAALGLWCLAGAWSAAQLTDGHIPAHMLEELSGTPDDAAWLVTARIWEPVEDGWQFVEWAPDQPLREAVLEARRKNAEKVTTWRSRNKPSSNPGTNSVTPAVSNAGTNRDVTLPPSQSRPGPVPTQSHEKSIVQPTVERVDPLEVEFDEFWKVYPRRQAKADARKAYKAARKSIDATTVLTGARAYALLTVGVEREYIKLPAGWLRDRRWEDDPIPQTPSKDARAAAVIEMGRQLAAVQPPADRFDNRAAECAQHPGYPANPCDRCARDALDGPAPTIDSAELDPLGGNPF